MTEEAAETMEWHGPAGDRTHRGRDYVERLQGSVGTFDDYQIEVVREVGDGGTVMVELVQRFRSDGNHHVLPEVMVFDVDPASGASPGSPFTSGAPTRSRRQALETRLYTTADPETRSIVQEVTHRPGLSPSSADRREILDLGRAVADVDHARNPTPVLEAASRPATSPAHA
jgi:hypothetical protein